MSRPISDAWFFRVKAATRDLVARCGGVVRAGELAMVSKTEISRWQSVGEEGIISITAALALEAECGMPLVTAVMADLHGRRLSDQTAPGEAASCLFRDYGDLMRQSAEVASTMADALSDGTVTPAEAERVDGAARNLATALDAMRKSLATVRATPVVSLATARAR
jgi:hypothetical protein